MGRADIRQELTFADDTLEDTGAGAEDVGADAGAGSGAVTGLGCWS